MLRFVIVAFLLIALLIFYVTRLGEGDGRVPESQLSGASSSEPSSGRVEAALPANEESLQERRGTEGIAYDADPRLSLVPNTFGCDIETLAANASPSSHLRGRRDEDQTERLLQTLTASGDAELQLATGLLVLSRDWATDDMRSRYGTMASIERAYATDPTNPLVLWSAAVECGAGATLSFCSDVQLQANAWRVLSADGQFWVRIATMRYQKDDKPGALDALLNAATAPKFDRYYLDHVRMMQRALSVVSEASLGSQAFAAYASAPTSFRFEVGEACISEAATRSEWLDACLAVAGRYASEASTIDEQRRGSRLLADLYEIAGQGDAAAAARARYRELADLGWAGDQDVLAVMLADERVMGHFLDELAAGGEVAAMQFVSDELTRLKQDPDYNPCPPNNEPGVEH